MSLYLSDEEKIKIEFFIRKCGNYCEPANLLHRLYSSFTIVEKELKRLDYALWERIIENDKSYMGTEQLPKIPDSSKSNTEEGDDRAE